MAKKPFSAGAFSILYIPKNVYSWPFPLHFLLFFSSRCTRNSLNLFEESLAIFSFFLGRGKRPKENENSKSSRLKKRFRFFSAAENSKFLRQNRKIESGLHLKRHSLRICFQMAILSGQICFRKKEEKI